MMHESTLNNTIFENVELTSKIKPRTFCEYAMIMSALTISMSNTWASAKGLSTVTDAGISFIKSDAAKAY